MHIRIHRLRITSDVDDAEPRLSFSEQKRAQAEPRL